MTDACPILWNVSWASGSSGFCAEVSSDEISQLRKLTLSCLKGDRRVLVSSDSQLLSQVVQYWMMLHSLCTSIGQPSATILVVTAYLPPVRPPDLPFTRVDRDLE